MLAMSASVPRVSGSLRDDQQDRNELGLQLVI